MLMYGIGSYIPDNTIVYNLASYKEGYQVLRLIPPNSVGHLYGYDFDVAYANYLLQYDEVFLEMFNIIDLLFKNQDVFLLISGEDWTENLIQSLFKFIQQRYGYNGVCINTEEDYNHYINKTFDLNPQYGLYNFNIDRDRYSMILEIINKRKGGYINDGSKNGNQCYY